MLLKSKQNNTYNPFTTNFKDKLTYADQILYTVQTQINLYLSNKLYHRNFNFITPKYKVENPKLKAGVVTHSIKSNSK